MIIIKNLYAEAGKFTLRNINLQVNPGEYFVLLGPTGSGKTLLLECILGIRKISAGSILMEGKNLDGMPIEERHIGYMPQDYALFPHMNVEENISYGLRIRKIPDKLKDEKVKELSGILGINHLLRRSVADLSGGEKQRVALARALASDLRVIFLDEPLGALDENTRNCLCGELLKIQKTFKLTFIHICHNFEEASNVADRIAIIKEGKIEQVGNVREIFDTPTTRFIAEFTRAENIFEGVSEGKKLNIGKTAVLATNNDYTGNVTVSFRPENVILSSKAITGKNNVFSGRIVELKDKGSFFSIRIDIGIMITAHGADYALFTGFACGNTVYVYIPPEAVHYIT